ncbi:MAG: hypothetical protein GF375_03480 [Candidatus Omnitrophica bacterium]|nr:hypothetical protein [Candidatus Omnitrophota bacterium]
MAQVKTLKEEIEINRKRARRLKKIKEDALSFIVYYVLGMALAINALIMLGIW